jgi:hypothetical protein
MWVCNVFFWEAIGNTPSLQDGQEDAGLLLLLDVV